jgi:hypothetical protein
MGEEEGDDIDDQLVQAFLDRIESEQTKKKATVKPAEEDRNQGLLLPEEESGDLHVAKGVDDARGVKALMEDDKAIQIQIQIQMALLGFEDGAADDPEVAQHMMEQMQAEHRLFSNVDGGAFLVTDSAGGQSLWIFGFLDYSTKALCVVSRLWDIDVHSPPIL